MAGKESPAVREYILQNVEDNPTSISSLAASKFELSRTSISRYMSRLESEGFISISGRTRGRIYKLKNIVEEKIYIGRRPPWTEDTIWRDRLLPMMHNVKTNIVEICQYGVTEMLNNIIDHSMYLNAIVQYKQTYTNIEYMIYDDGVGIFNKIKSDFHLNDARTALLELSKGKLTSDKRRHSGEGIYFTSRMFNQFSLYSGELYYRRKRKDDDGWLIETDDEETEKPGTLVTLKIRTDADWTTREVFETSQKGNVYFRTTHVPVALGRYPGEQLVSRSQAKRILARFTEFAEVILDFTGVAEIGQPFADEIFRVFRNEHPSTPLLAVGTNENIDRMIRHVQGRGDRDEDQKSLF